MPSSVSPPLRGFPHDVENRAEAKCRSPRCPHSTRTGRAPTSLKRGLGLFERHTCRGRTFSRVTFVDRLPLDALVIGLMTSPGAGWLSHRLDSRRGAASSGIFSLGPGAALERFQLPGRYGHRRTSWDVRRRGPCRRCACPVRRLRDPMVALPRCRSATTPAALVLPRGAAAWEAQGSAQTYPSSRCSSTWPRPAGG